MAEIDPSTVQSSPAPRRELAYTSALVACLLLLAFAPVLLHDGWPRNHEGLSWKYRLLTYVAHFRRLELLPIWSESAALGLGAPSPVLYHKLFYFVAAGIYLLSGSVKTALVATLGGFSVLGLLGLRAVLCRLGVPARAALVAGAALLFCNYSYTDWVVRGAFAEYSAMLLLPWLFRWLLGVLSGESARSLLRLGVAIFPALYLAHAGLFFFAAVPVLSATLWRWLRGKDRKAFALALLGIAGSFGLVALPIVVCQLLLVSELSFAEGIALYLPRDHFSSLDQHLSGGQYVWGASPEGVSVQIDLPLVALAVLVLLALAWAPVRRRAGMQRAPSAAALANPNGLTQYLACWAWLAYFAFLLSPRSAALYEHVPGFSSLQFPWRLLSFVSVLSVMLAAFPLLILARGEKKDWSWAPACLLLAVRYASSPWLHEIRYPWLSEREVEAPLPATARLVVGGFEYHPRVSGVAGTELIDYTNGLRPKPDALVWSRPDYRVERVDEPAFEKGERSYRVHSVRPSTVVLPLAYCRFIHLDSIGHGREGRLSTYREPQDPRIHFDVPAGETEVRVRFPTLLSVYADVLSAATR